MLTTILVLVLGSSTPIVPMMEEVATPLVAEVDWAYEEFRVSFKPSFKEAFHASSGRNPGKGFVEEACRVSYDHISSGGDMVGAKALVVALAARRKGEGTLFFIKY